MKKIIALAWVGFSLILSVPALAGTLEELIIQGPQWNYTQKDIEKFMTAGQDFAPVNIVEDCGQAGRKGEVLFVCDKDIPSPFIYFSETVYKSLKSEMPAYLAFDFNRVGGQVSEMFIAFPSSAFGNDCDEAGQTKAARRWVTDILLEAVPALKDWDEKDYGFNAETDRYEFAVLCDMGYYCSLDDNRKRDLKDQGHLTLMYTPPKSISEPEYARLKAYNDSLPRLTPGLYVNECSSGGQTVLRKIILRADGTGLMDVGCDEDIEKYKLLNAGQLAEDGRYELNISWEQDGENLILDIQDQPLPAQPSSGDNIAIESPGYTHSNMPPIEPENIYSNMPPIAPEDPRSFRPPLFYFWDIEGPNIIDNTECYCIDCRPPRVYRLLEGH